MGKINVRLCLSDFYNTDIEKSVMNKLVNIHKKKSVQYYLELWYEDGKINSDDIKNFLIKYEDTLSFKTKIKVDNEIKVNDFVWFDIIKNTNLINNSRVRYTYAYNNYDDILNGLDEFSKCAVFCTSEKPKKQKRNDDESSDYRKS